MKDYKEENKVKYIEQVIPKDIFNSTKILVNGDFIGIHDKPNELTDTHKEFIKAIRGDSAVLHGNLDDALEVMKLIDMIYKKQKKIKLR